MISKKLTLADVVIIALAIIAAFSMFIPELIPTDGQTLLCIISDDGEEYLRLTENESFYREIVSRGIKVVIKAENGKAFIESSQCPNGICVRSPAVKKAGESIVCAPAGLALIVKNVGGEGDADAIAG